jgi:hypothetical protein
MLPRFNNGPAYVYRHRNGGKGCRIYLCNPAGTSITATSTLGMSGVRMRNSTLRFNLRPSGLSEAHIIGV